jgi:outer membrane protein TolC
VLQPVFDGFTLLHKERSAEAALDQTIAQYRLTVIGAVQNVADSLRALQNDADALKAAHDFERASRVSLDLAQQQLQTGQINILLLLTAQTTYQQSVIALVQAQANRLSDTVALYQALGGGWWNRDDLAPNPANSTPAPTRTAGTPVPIAVVSAPTNDVAQTGNATDTHN